MDLHKLNPDEPIPGLASLTVADFWSWAFSDIMSNATRGIFAEFLVTVALGVSDTPRVAWDNVDVRYKDKKIEVKCSAYVQSWFQNAPSRIAFGIGKRRPWDAHTNVLGLDAVRSADCYVFCLYPETDQHQAHILDVPAWHFYVLTTERINRAFGDQKSVSLASLEAICKHITFGELKQRIDELLLDMRK